MARDSQGWSAVNLQRQPAADSLTQASTWGALQGQARLTPEDLSLCPHQLLWCPLAASGQFWSSLWGVLASGAWSCSTSYNVGQPHGGAVPPVSPVLGCEASHPDLRTRTPWQEVTAVWSRAGSGHRDNWPGRPHVGRRATRVSWRVGEGWRGRGPPPSRALLGQPAQGVRKNPGRSSFVPDAEAQDVSSSNQFPALTT